MKIKLLFFALVTASIIFAQEKTGINTTDPTTTLDVNGNARVRVLPDGSDQTQYRRALVVKDNGELGVVNRTTPGTPGASDVVFENARVRTDITRGVLLKDFLANPNTQGKYIYSGRSITLPPGKWVISLGYLVPRIAGQLRSNENIWSRAIISDNINTGPKDSTTDLEVGSPTLVSGAFTPGATYAMINGSYLLINSSTVDKTYYLKIFIDGSLAQDSTLKIGLFSVYGEDYMYAFRRL